MGYHGLLQILLVFSFTEKKKDGNFLIYTDKWENSKLAMHFGHLGDRLLSKILTRNEHIFLGSIHQERLVHKGYRGATPYFACRDPTHEFLQVFFFLKLHA